MGHSAKSKYIDNLFCKNKTSLYVDDFTTIKIKADLTWQPTIMILYFGQSLDILRDCRKILNLFYSLLLQTLFLFDVANFYTVYSLWSFLFLFNHLTFFRHFKCKITSKCAHPAPSRKIPSYWESTLWSDNCHIPKATKFFI